MPNIASTREWIPYEYRPVVGFNDVAVLRNGATLPNSYYVETDKIVLIHSDEIVEHRFTDPSRFAEQVALLEASGIRRVEFGKGLLRLLAIIAGFVVFLQVLVSITG